MSLAICFVLVLNPVCQSVSFSISTADYCIVFSRSSFLFFSLYATSRGTLGGEYLLSFKSSTEWLVSYFSLQYPYVVKQTCEESKKNDQLLRGIFFYEQLDSQGVALNSTGTEVQNEWM